MDQFIGDIQLFPYTFAPEEWTYCNGQLLSVQQYTALYSLLGNQFGGDGYTTFGVPDLQDASPVQGMQYCIALTGIYPQRP